MADREEYIKVLSKAVKTVKEYNEDAPIKISLQCIEDILELLKEQDAQNVVNMMLAKDWDRAASCPKCNESLKWVYHRNYCGYCGQKVKWE